MKKIAIFASGNGSNAEEIIKHFSGHPSVEVTLILSNKPEAYVIERAKKHNIAQEVFGKEELKNGEVLSLLKDKKIDYIVLAGFLLLIPAALVEAYPDRIINIHPALLPKYGGKGMYGDRVHRAVKENGDKETGITIHLVNEKYDEGKTLFQATCDVKATDTVDDIADKVHQLEYAHFPKVIEECIIER
ncbi:phosphoribosylglycinamide formyltransferase [Fulvivirga sp. RKSG066]|uniref:phosphoribosylglycinamide formyltransferase n=1 Tax=Fulvivirga aurantia TaxID=2529383 RepID=UPI0012BC3CB3|nr:phosphoribosylglycinamide formyltransferase [Fulvivirga aurantia]MTI21994.1 phosphoribosylglycinamide formyltransferase [Fulvivirga aurantia]